MKRGKQGGQPVFRESRPLSQVAKIRTFGRRGDGLSFLSHHAAPRDKMDGWMEGRKGGIVFDLLSKNDFLASLHASVPKIGPRSNQALACR